MARCRVLIMGAAGRDFHNFNTYFRGNSDYEVVAFTATQIPDIEGRTYPARLAGEFYPEGIPIHAEEDLPGLIREHEVDQVVFAYSDVPHEYVMNRASKVLSCGADFRLMGPRTTMLRSRVPVVAVTAVRTGAGKSQTTRRAAEILTRTGRRVVVVRHPMPYGDLTDQSVQRFADYTDLDKQRCTIEEREEYEPHLDRGNVVFAGVDYQAVLRQAEEEADVILWDGGNNDLPFYVPDLHITVADPHRPGHEVSYHPGETNLRMAHVVIINKVDSAGAGAVEAVLDNVRRVNPRAVVVQADSPVTVDHPELVRGRKVLVVEDGPTLTHGDMASGAGMLAARKHGAAEIVDPRPYAVGTIRDTFAKYGRLTKVLPAMGYGEEQVGELAETINRAPAELVIIGTPIDLRRVLTLDKPAVRVRYELAERGKPDLADIIEERLH
ncbi:MAG: GTPase [Candidatus Desulforudis sp.]|nr:GTPase [Desulforudis sp.]